MREKMSGKTERREFPGDGTIQTGAFGDRLRREREMRGVSLDDIAAATKIGTRLLRALEDEHFDLLPGGIFNKGFVRAYAKYLGLNEDEAVADYLQAAGESAPDPKVIAEQNSSGINRSGMGSSNSRAASFPIIPVLILLLVIAAGVGGWQIYQERQRDRQAKREAMKVSTVTTQETAAVTNPSTLATPASVPEASAAKTVTSNNPTASPTNTVLQANPKAAGSTDLNLPASKPSDVTGTKPAAPSSESAKPGTTGAAGAATESFEVTVRAKESAWVSIKSDGRFIVRGIIRPPDVKTVHASGQIVFWTGNAGAVEVLFNGQPVALAGGPNQEGVLVFNSHGVVPSKTAQ
jgi:cytoskeleton protein RodZ